MTTTTPADGSPTLLAGLGAFVALLGALAAVGAVLALRLLAAGAPHEAHVVPAGTFRVAEDVPTGFGFVAVEHAETTKGLSPRQLGGATHGIGNFVGRDKALVQASITITNTGEGTLRYSPSQFRLAARSPGGAVHRYAPSSATVRAGILQPDAAIDAKLSFTVPRDGARLAVEFLETGRRAPVTILLGTGSGRLTAADRRALAEGHHAAGTPAHRHDG